ncbi:cellulose biosynthesis protein BcsG [Paraburkholderia susongensis]|uniref:Cellulose biosynthesis protein BcsG n=1 Tax=Paraburkholderia susongensis TaxID=1515439 RepID=A0A1X7LR69_9BURK|nr:cellulose biosynthesis protein BcsG [Paraburkholderia susongensis]SMG56371.1 Cellulose biosynthesis protein BcsG [Paraburkholderia susongensis]
MGLWNLYFIVKLYLGGTRTLQPAWWLNLLFAVALLVPFGDRRLRILRNVVATVIAIALLYYEVSVPALSAAGSPLPSHAALTPHGVLELIARTVPLSALYTIITLIVAYFLINRWVRVTTFVLAALIVIPLWQGVGALTAHAGSNLEHANACAPATGQVRSEPTVNTHGG